MVTQFTMRRVRRVLASALSAATLLTMSAPFAAAQGGYPAPPTNNPNLRSSATKKLVAIGGAALLYYLYKKHQAAASGATTNRTAVNYNAKGGAMTTRPQLYRSKNGGIYYRDAQKRPVWLTVPPQPVQVPASDLQRYAPDYARYRGPAPVAPSGYTTQPFSDFDRTLMSANGVPPPPGRSGVPGPAGARM